MTDSITHKPFIIRGDSEIGSHFSVPVEQLEKVKAALLANQIAFWVDADALSINNGPEVTFINFGRGVDPAKVQQLLDAA